MAGNAYYLGGGVSVALGEGLQASVAKGSLPFPADLFVSPSGEMAETNSLS
jgi:hypothetical protein